MPDALNYRESLDYSWRRIGKESIQEPGLEPDNGPNMSLVLVIGLSPVNRVVISRIVERAGLKVLCEAPHNAQRSLLACHPGTVIADCGCDNSDCDGFVPLFERSRALHGGSLPLLIMLSTAGVQAGGTLLAGLADAIISKPITVEGLQPVILRLIEAAQH
jgi:CheY-like chemotaxis protein